QSSMRVCSTDYPTSTTTDTLSLPDALPIYRARQPAPSDGQQAACIHAAAREGGGLSRPRLPDRPREDFAMRWIVTADYWGNCLRSEEHTSELQSRENLVCRLLLEKKNKISY